MTHNLVSKQLKQQALNAPFVLERQNYLTACEEIDRLQHMWDSVHACVTDSTSDAHMIVARLKLILAEHAP